MIVAAVALSWFVISGVVALAIAWFIRVADESAPSTDRLMSLPADLTVADVLGERRPQLSH